MSSISFVVNEVRGKGRPRFFKGHAVTDKKTRDYEAEIAYLAKKEMERQKLDPLVCPVSVNLEIFFKIPKSATKKKRQEIADNNFYCLKKPDTDNVIKAVLDGCNKVVYKDDSQVYDIHAIKKYSISDFEGVIVTFNF